MNKFVKRPAAGAPALSPRAVLENKYKLARMNLLFAIIFTLINIIALFTNGGSYFLFSAYVPYLLVGLGADWCGLMPPEYYEGMTDLEFLDPSVFVVLAVIAAIILVLYALCFFMSKKNKSGWFVFALVMFSIDTVALLMFLDIQYAIIDLLFHAWVIYYLIIGIRIPNKLQALAEQEAAAEAAAAEAARAEREAAQAAAQEAADTTADAPEETAAELPDAWAELNARAEDADKTES